MAIGLYGSDDFAVRTYLQGLHNSVFAFSYFLSASSHADEQKPFALGIA